MRLTDELGDLVQESKNALAGAENIEADVNDYRNKDCNCAGDPTCSTACSNLKFDTTAMSAAVTSLDDAHKQLVNSDAFKINEAIEEAFELIPDEINKMTKELVNELEEPLEDINTSLENGLKIVEDSLGNFTQSLTDIVEDMDEYFDIITEANFYRSIGYIVIAVLVLIIALTSLIGVFIPHRKCALVFLKSSLFQQFIWSAIFMIIVSQYLKYILSNSSQGHGLLCPWWFR